MHKVKAFFYVSLGLLALAVAFHLGARSAQSQGVSTVAGITYRGGVSGDFNVVVQNGDVYSVQATGALNPVYRGNIFSGSGPVPTAPTTWGGIKAERR